MIRATIIISIMLLCSIFFNCAHREAFYARHRSIKEGTFFRFDPLTGDTIIILHK